MLGLGGREGMFADVFEGGEFLFEAEDETLGAGLGAEDLGEDGVFGAPGVAEFGLVAVAGVFDVAVAVGVLGGLFFAGGDEDLGFGAVVAGEAPVGVGELFDEIAADVGLGFVEGEVEVEVGLVGGGVFVGEEAGLGVDAVAEGVEADAVFPCVGTWAGGEFGVVAVDFGALLGGDGHVGVLSISGCRRDLGDFGGNSCKLLGLLRRFWISARESLG